MAKEFLVPELGENISSGTLSKILVAVGDMVTAGQILLEIETDKAVAEIPCSFSGKVLEVRVQEGQKVTPGTVILVLDESVSMDTSQVKTPLPPKESIPANVSKTSSMPDDMPQTHSLRKATSASSSSSLRLRAAPSVRKLAREHSVDLNKMPIADPTGKVTARDVMEFVAGRADTPDESLHIAETEDNAPYGSNATQQDSWGEVQIELMNAIRSKAAAHLAHCWTDIPHVTHFDKADVTDLEAFRKEYASKAERQGAKLTITAFLLKALAETLKTFPRFNASLDLEKQQMLLKKYYHVGVAVDTPNGLMVPVLRHVNEKNVLEIAREMSEVAEKARDRKLTLEDMRGGTFTVSNLGGLGGYAFTPIINAPEVAILGVSRSQMEPVYQGGAWIPRLMLPLCLSYDHRIIDGADAARFLRFLAEALEKPWRLFLGL